MKSQKFSEFAPSIEHLNAVFPKNRIKYPIEYKANLEFRRELLKKARKDSKFRQDIKLYTFKDITFFFDCFLYIYCPVRHPDSPHRPFILWKYQREILVPAIVERILYGGDLIALKKRSIGFTYTVTGIFLFFFLNPFFPSDFLLGSVNEETVDRRGDMDSLFEKVRYLLKSLPDWLLPKGFKWREHDRTRLLINPETGVSIRGKANTADFGAGGRARAAFLDEYSLWYHTDAAAWSTLTDTVSCRIACGTPARERLIPADNDYTSYYFYQLFSKRQPLRTNPNLKLPSIYEFDWRYDDEMSKKDVEREKQQRGAIDFAINVLGTFDIPQSGRHFPQYDKFKHVRQLTYIKEKPVYVGIDYGFLHPCVVCAQVDDDDCLLILKCILGKQIDIFPFAKYVKSKLKQWFGEGASFIYLADEAGQQRTDKGMSVEALIAAGLSPVIPVPNKKERMTVQIRNKLTDEYNGKPGLLINDEIADSPIESFISTESCAYIHRCFQYIKTKKTNELSWERDEYLAHGMDCIGYIVLYLFPYFERREMAKKRKDRWRELQNQQKERRHWIAK